MASDKGGRRADLIALEQTVGSPLGTVMSTAGGEHFEEPMQRHPAENHSTEDKRQERKQNGYVHFKAESRVPDVGGVGWRTRTGHILKNQTYYSMSSKTNLWDQPVHAGINSWKDWHGPKLRTDAGMMEQLDHYDQTCDEWEAKKCFVNTIRTQTLDRFYNRKLNRDQFEASRSWAPHRRARREVNDCHEHFFGDLDSKPEKELKKVLTPQVLQRDRDAIRAISSRIQNEETWKLAWRHMEQERRQDIKHDFKQRQNYNDLLMQLSGQPVRQREWEGSQSMRLTNCSIRTENLSVAREPAPITDVTSQTDFRGLFHADNEHALEALFPGSGHELSMEFRQRATASTKAGWPAPAAASTPRLKGKKGAREKTLQKEATLTTEKVPVSKPRLDNVATRHHDDTLKHYSKAQFLSTVAPPPMDQKKQLLNEDFSPKTTLHDPGRVTGSFQRTEQGILPHGRFHPGSPKRKGMEHLPPAQRSYTYPVLAPTSPTARGAQASAQASEGNSPMSTFQSSASSPLRRNSSLPSVSAKRRSLKGTLEAPSAAVCRELDQFEANLTSLPRVSNCFGTPRSQRRAASSQMHMQGPGRLDRSQSAAVASEPSADETFSGLSRSASAPVAAN
jgi:hypothetical protein